MVQTLKKQSYEADSIEEYYKTFYIAQQKFKPIVLNYLFRNVALITKQENIREISKREYSQISKTLSVPKAIVQKFISKFLEDLQLFRNFLLNNPEILKSKDQERKVRIYLHKLYRMAPIFDYKRARENAGILKKKLDHLFFWPQVMTQIAVIIFITDILDKNSTQKIIQSNLRTFCSCSAYAFHRTRNKVGLTSEYIKSL
ncbi:MAG: hypothetical protein HWN81_02310 [Candidatus Lokiarchaeota archaeon]|nr:hypothetical protein [Candidatus Lokiarchaeota archaeon]